MTYNIEFFIASNVVNFISVVEDQNHLMRFFSKIRCWSYLLSPIWFCPRLGTMKIELARILFSYGEKVWFILSGFNLSLSV